MNEGFVWWHGTENRAELIENLLIGAALLTASASLLPTRSSGIERVPLTSPTRTSWNDARREAKRLLGLELEVLNMESKLTAALLHGDFAALRRIYADDYVSVNPRASSVKKRARLESSNPVKSSLSQSALTESPFTFMRTRLWSPDELTCTGDSVAKSVENT